MTIKHPKDNSQALSLTITNKQLFTIFRALNELEIVFEQQYHHLYPTQKREIKIAVRHLKKFKVWRVIETALSEGQRLKQEADNEQV